MNSMKRIALGGVVMLAATTVDARRAPAPGGTVVMSLPPELLLATVEAHVYAPLFSWRTAQTLAEPVTGAPEYASDVIAALKTTDDGRTWRLRAQAPPADVAAAVMRCVLGGHERVRGVEAQRVRFAERALSAAGVQAEIAVGTDEVVVRFSRPVFVVPELLTDCPLRSPSNTPTGTFALQAPGRLAWRSGSYQASPLLGAIELRAPLSDSERADVVVAQETQTAGAVLLSPWPDVIALVQEPATVGLDPFAVKDDIAAFRQALRGDLLAAAWAQGRGGPTFALLPPGVAPARPLPHSPTAGQALPLSLQPLPKDAPRVSLRMTSGDPLTEATAERLAVILRGRRMLLEAKDSAGSDVELVRWRPPSNDPAIALLAFIGERPGLLAEPAVQKAATDERLLGKDVAARLAAALALERVLLEQRLVVPLIVVERSVIVDPDLRGVVVRGDGVPLLDGAWWGGAR